jgi:pimeloyl-ACP methyl ester carboxylesterase
MSEPNSDNTRATASAPHPRDDPNNIIVSSKPGITLLNGGTLEMIARMPLPGIVIFVHGVNSDGEWYAQAEEGLCAGLNERLKRCDEHMAHPTPEGGQLTPATYKPELTPDGYIQPKLDFESFINGDDHFTPVIRFRWGYKASTDELQKYGDGIYLNEKNYWGGGPFANGCTALPDLWGDGLSENLLLWMHIQHLNPVNGRYVFSCPPKPYFVLAALRLARLVESIRVKQADVPITIVCHSQGNMIGMAAAFFGDARAPVRDSAGVEGRCVANTYVLCNPPYSLTMSNFAEDWSQSDMKDKHGGTGRQSRAARIGTLRAFFDIVRQPPSRRQKVEDINQAMENVNHAFCAAADCKAYGNASASSGRITLYCNPHDQVISSQSVQGIGWRGMSREEIEAASGAGIFSQRVFAQGVKVGVRGIYDYWDNHYLRPEPGAQEFWVPASPQVEYSVPKGLDASRHSVLGIILTLGMAPIAIVAFKLSGMRVNALPDKKWAIPLEAPDLPDPFEPKAMRFGVPDDQFDQAYEAPGQFRNRHRPGDAGPYTGDRPIPRKKGEPEREPTDAPLGDEGSEAVLRYEDHARLRMQARREGMAKKTDEHVDGEDDATKASAEYKAWQEKKITSFLAESIDELATDHSTIMTNGMHARRALAYDVAIGLCHIGDEDMHKLRIAADWRFLKGVDDDDPCKIFKEYFLSGKFTKVSPYEWTRAKNSEGRMPDKIVDEREHPPLQPRSRERLNRGGHP